MTSHIVKAWDRLCEFLASRKTSAVLARVCRFFSQRIVVRRGDEPVRNSIHPPTDAVQVAKGLPTCTIIARKSYERVTGFWHECPGFELKVSVGTPDVRFL